jgi:hypothetical protein
MVLETLIFSPFNHLTRLVAREDFIIHSRCESSRLYSYAKAKPSSAFETAVVFLVCYCSGLADHL